MMKYVNEALAFHRRLVPESNKQREVEIITSWVVRWTSRQGEFSSDTRSEAEVFASKAIADEFAQSLRMAFKLLRHTSKDRVTVSRSDA